jgi:hypothetical protein
MCVHLRYKGIEWKGDIAARKLDDSPVKGNKEVEMVNKK